MHKNYTDPTNKFFSRWDTYDRVVSHNYMYHREIRHELGDFLDRTFNGKSLSILDIGCGDCSQITATMDSSSIGSYVGVDISAVALEAAEERLSELAFSFRLLEQDFTAFIEKCESSSFDLVLAGYSVHHLKYHNKQDFFRNCYRILRPGGYLAHYDVMRLNGETRSQYLERYFDIINGWEYLEDGERTFVMEHISECDFPSSPDELFGMVKDPGFKLTPGMLYADESSIHSLSCFQK